MMQTRFLHILFACISGLAAFGVYVKTLAPTVPFWDGGEFIAASYILGIPHPPGSPLYILFGRLFSLLPFGPEVAWRVNLSSALFSALAVVFVYLIVVKAVALWRGKPRTLADAFTVYTGGLVGALMLAFSDTYWFSSVEAEVYTLSMLFIMVCTWLLLHWIERHEAPGSERYLFLIAYLTFLGIAVHMFTLLIAPAVFLCAIYTDRQEIGTPKMIALFAVMGVIMGSVVASIDPFFAGVMLTISGLVLFKDRIPWAWYLVPVAGAFLIYLGGVEDAGGYNTTPIEMGSFAISVGTLMVTLILVGVALALVSATAQEPTRYRWKFWAVLLTLIAVGYSVNFYVPLRAAQQPAINENDPSNWKNFEGFLERKQYGQESMLVSMFARKGSWSSQFGNGENIGFWRFFSRQYSAPSFPNWLFPVLLGLLGISGQWRREKRSALYLTVMTLICSVGLVLYMNFSDGTRGVQMEVRERDYFFMPAFVFFSILIGLGVIEVLDHVRLWIKQYSLPGIPVMTASTAIAIVLPVIPLTHHYPTHTREGNYIPYDYGYNILQSCDKNAILFTNGDNDTFTLWFLQEVEGIRRDVRVVNLSLLNTNWYIKQLKHQEPKVPISLSDETIDRMGLQLWEDREVEIAGLSWVVPKAGALPDGRGYIRIQDLMILHILQTNNWQRPMYFAVTVSPDNKIGLDDHLRMEGMVFRIVKEAGQNQMDLARTHHNLWNVYQYRGIADPAVYKDDQTRNLLRNYSAAFQQLAYLLYREGRVEEAIQELEKYRTLKISDGIWERSLLAQFYAEVGRFDKAEEMAGSLIAQDSTFGDGYILLSDLYRRQDKLDEAIAVVERGIAQDSGYRRFYEQLALLHSERADTARVVETLERLLEIAPGDSIIRKTVQQLQR